MKLPLHHWLLILAATGVLAGDNDTRQEVKLAFLVAAKTPPRHSSSRPNRHLLQAFNYGLDRINQLHSGAQVRFSSLLVETAPGNESHSIRQLVALISGRLGGQVNAILGPQDTCHLLEPSLAGAFNLALLSYQCDQPSAAAHQWSTTSALNSSAAGDADNRWTNTAGTLIQTKPPHWKIVRRVVRLLELMLAANNWYPQQLVLLYFKEHPAVHSWWWWRLKSQQLAAAASSQSAGSQPHTPVDPRLAIEAIQYRLIGELLEMELARLLEKNGSRRKPLVVLNWNTTFHYGFTRNPFVRLVRRHLARATRQRQQCAPDGQTVPTESVEANAIFIVVGHYYEHLGLMLALDEMNLLHNGQQQQQSLAGGEDPRRRSVVVGVDTEHYDERYDSARFLHGLLMDQEARRSSKGVQHGVPEQVAGAMYGHYLGLLPARPTRMADFLAGMYAHLERSNNLSPAPFNAKPSTSNQTTSIQQSIGAQHLLSARLFQLIRLPVEAFYLYDGLQLLGAYFASCLHSSNSSLADCSDGWRVANWFRNRQYQTSLDDNDTCFDEQAQAEGSYVLISRRLGGLNDSSSSAAAAQQDSSGEQDEFGSLVGQVGRFVTPTAGNCGADSHKLPLEVKFQANLEEIDPIWHPLWCLTTALSSPNQSAMCQALLQTFQNEPFDHLDELGQSPQMIPVQQLLMSTLLLLLVLLVVLLSAGRLSSHFHQAKKLSSGERHQQPGNGWFNATDERNFSLIVQRYLLQPEALSAAGVSTTASGVKPEQQQQQAASNTGCHMLQDLHCHMFPFPSCKFVHWLTALHQLKEMMFQYQSSEYSSSSGAAAAHSWTYNFRYAPGRLLRGAFVREKNGGAQTFFRGRHKGTASLRLLLNKYKSVNQCFCTLAELKHQSVVSLSGLMLSYEPTRVALGKSERLAHLVLERPQRGHLREAFAKLNENLELSGGSSTPQPASEQLREFRDLLIRHCVRQLLSGLEYLHKSSIQFHGELRATTCYLTADWHLKLSGFHAHHLRRSLGEYEQKNFPPTYLDCLVYTAPEVLELHERRTTLGSCLLKLADVYSFGFLAYELITGHEPWSCLLGSERCCSSKLLVDRVKVDANFRPPLSRLDKRIQAPPASQVDEQHHSFVVQSSNSLETCLGGFKLDAVKQLIHSCWSPQPHTRPQSVAKLIECFESSLLSNSLQQEELQTTTTPDNPGSTSASLVVRYATQLESIALNRKRMLDRERKRSRDLKLKMLPESIIIRLASARLNHQHQNISGTPPIQSEQFKSVSVCVFRFVLVPVKISGDDDQLEVDQCSTNLEHLNEILIQLDRLVESYQRFIHLIDSPVDSSMRFLAYSGELLTFDHSLGSRHQQLVASFALQLIDLANRCQSRLNNCSIQVSCGLHCGPLLAGLMPERDGLSLSSSSRYVLMGSALRVANSLEQSCLPQRIQISAMFRHHLLQAQQQQRHREGHLPPPSTTENTSASSLLFSSQQDYVIMKRDVKVYPTYTASSITRGLLMPTNSSDFSGNNSSRQALKELFWLVNGPRLTTGQSLFLSQYAL